MRYREHLQSFIMELNFLDSERNLKTERCRASLIKAAWIDGKVLGKITVDFCVECNILLPTAMLCICTALYIWESLNGWLWRRQLRHGINWEELPLNSTVMMNKNISNRLNWPGRNKLRSGESIQKCKWLIRKRQSKFFKMEIHYSVDL